MTTPAVFFDWVRECKPELKNLDDIPLTASPTFPWEELAARLGKTFERDGFQIQPQQLNWTSVDQLYEGLGDHPKVLSFAIPSLKGSCSWVIPEQELALLEGILLTKEAHPISFEDHALSESFYRFVAAETLYQFSQLSFDKSITPILLKEAALPDEDSLCLDIRLSIQSQSIWGRLIISPELRASWASYFSKKQQQAMVKPKLPLEASVILNIETGHTVLNLQQWSEVQLGDVILLDKYSQESEGSSSVVMLTYDGRPVFRGKLKDGKIKLIELPLTHEVDTPMTKQEDEDEFSDLDYSEDEESSDESFEESSDEDIEEDDDEASDFDMDLDLEEEDEEIQEESKNEVDQDVENAQIIEKKTPEITEPLSAKAPKPHPLASQKKTPISAAEIPVTLTVEVGHIQITVQKLLQLEPGNLLELNVNPEEGVDLTINGRVVGKGELIRLGETIGVRVLDIGR